MLWKSRKFRSTRLKTNVLNILYFLKNELWINGRIKSILLGAFSKNRLIESCLWKDFFPILTLKWSFSFYKCPFIIPYCTWGKCEFALWMWVGRLSHVFLSLALSGREGVWSGDTVSRWEVESWPTEKSIFIFVLTLSQLRSLSSIPHQAELPECGYIFR